MLSGEGQHHLASAAVAVCKGIECLLEVLCLEHMRGDLIDLFQVVRQDLDHLGELLVLMTGPQNGQFLCIDLLEVHGDRLLAKGHSHQTACGRKLAGCMCQQCGNACGLKDHVDTLAVGQFVDERIVTAEAKLDLERKGVQSYQRDLYARFLCFGNGALTSLYDHSDGFFRRQLILTTKDKPADRTDDPFLVEKMCAELEGILLWCLEGLHRLVQSDFHFTVSERAAANVDTIKRSSNNVIDFMESEGYFRFKADYSISSKEFYDIYKQWCEDNACHSVSAIRFSAELRQNDRRYNLEATNNIYLPGGRRVRGFVGIEPLVHPCP